MNEYEWIKNWNDDYMVMLYSKGGEGSFYIYR